jgi:hypothetical protein
VVSLARSNGRRVLALSLPPVPCRKAVTCVDFFGTGNVISNVVVQELWREERHVYKWSDTYQISLRNYCISLNFNARIFVFCLLSVCVCFVCFWTTLTIISLNSITNFILSLEVHCVSFEVGSKFLKNCLETFCFSKC